MFGIGLPELILIMALALIVVGPDKLPDLAKSIAKQILELKKTANSLKESLQEELQEGEEVLKKSRQEVEELHGESSVQPPEDGSARRKVPEETRLVTRDEQQQRVSQPVEIYDLAIARQLAEQLLVILLHGSKTSAPDGGSHVDYSEGPRTARGRSGLTTRLDGRPPCPANVIE